MKCMLAEVGGGGGKGGGVRGEGVSWVKADTL